MTHTLSPPRTARSEQGRASDSMAATSGSWLSMARGNRFDGMSRSIWFSMRCMLEGRPGSPLVFLSPPNKNIGDTKWSASNPQQTQMAAGLAPRRLAQI